MLEKNYNTYIFQVTHPVVTFVTNTGDIVYTLAMTMIPTPDANAIVRSLRIFFVTPATPAIVSRVLGHTAGDARIYRPDARRGAPPVRELLLRALSAFICAAALRCAFSWRFRLIQSYSVSPSKFCSTKTS